MKCYSTSTSPLSTNLSRVGHLLNLVKVKQTVMKDTSITLLSNR